MPFEFPFRISKGERAAQQSLVVALKMGGLFGIGEATQIDYYNVSVDDMVRLLEAKRPLLEHYTIIDPERFWHFLHHLLPGNHFLISALDIAGWDFYGHMKGRMVYELLGLAFDPDKNPLTDYTLGISEPGEIAAKIDNHPASVYKVKMGGTDDLDTLRTLRLHTAAKIRVDANEAWTVEDAVKILPALDELDIELIEQPLKRGDEEGMKRLKKCSRIPFIADESCHDIQDLDACEGLFDGINVKLSKCGGITPAVALIKAARSKSMSIMLGCMSEGHAGTAAAANLLPLADYADLDGPLLLSDPFVKGVRYENGRVHLDGRQGTGAVIR